MIRNLSITLLLALLAAPALAQAALAEDDEYGGAPVSDYRWAVYTACTLVFLAIIVYLVSAHRRMSRAADDVAHLERRVKTLESGS